MLKRVLTRIHEAEKRWAASWGTDISTPQGRRAARWHAQLADHAFLRVLWTNLYEIAPGVWRSNQPSPKRLDRYHAMGIRTILNLRGEERFSYYLFEHEAAKLLGIEVVDYKIHARSLPPKETYLGLLDTLESLKPPFLMHCKSGADRAGLASAFWLLHVLGEPVEVAKKQLHWRYAHLKSTRTGILDHMLDAFAAANAATGIKLRPWIETEYNPDPLTASFLARKAKDKG